MSRPSTSTPCPAPNTLVGLEQDRRLSTASNATFQDDTANIDYTRALRQNFQNARPKRKSYFPQKGKKVPGITVFEDVAEDEELALKESKDTGGGTLLGKPAQRLPKRRHGDLLEQYQPVGPVGQSRTVATPASPAIAFESKPRRGNETRSGVEPARGEQAADKGLKKNPRRRTIFVPEDTTVMTIHPGGNNTAGLNDTFQLPAFPAQPRRQPVSGVEEGANAVKPARKARMSLAAAPKRAPLQSVSRDGNAPAVDAPGANTGKENVPPRTVRLQSRDHKLKPDPAKTLDLGVAPVRSSLHELTAASRARQSNVARKAVPLPKGNSVARKSQPPRPASFVKRSPLQRASPSQTQERAREPPQEPPLKRTQLSGNSPTSAQARPKGPTQRRRPQEARMAKLQHYPVLSEDIAQPELYEDSWLGHQEVALTELANQLFKDAEPQPFETHSDPVSLRERLIQVYHQPSVTTLHRRLQASLRFGTLSRPKDMSDPPSPSKDIGLRKRFHGLWLDSYDQTTLRAAVEVVVGRQIPQITPFDGFGATEGILDPHGSRRAFIGFLETFFVEVEDAEDSTNDRADARHPRWRKMMERSLMLIWLLDQAKGAQMVTDCLFKKTSPRKSSFAVLNALASMFIPSVGDISRSLRHMGYELEHVQDPLDEVRYNIDNIAVDLRDGVFMTRLVELLIFSSDKHAVDGEEADATVTVQMPDLTMVQSPMYDAVGERCPRLLSQHLKMPCLGRAQKVSNVQLAISALQTHGRFHEAITDDLRAEDLVDGHREKTLSFLWSLIGHHGLAHLVKFEELMADIERNAINDDDLATLYATSQPPSQIQQEDLLKDWASVYCAKQHTKLANLTTAFADGTPYAAILDAFASYLPNNTEQRNRNSITTSSARPSNTTKLETQLAAFGCSAAFTAQLTSARGTIPSRKTTISNLAFLASRLLLLAKRHNAATCIQRAFRLKQTRVMVSRRLALVRVAHDCARVVQTRNTVVWAATVLQGAWRRVVDGRVGRLNGDVGAFQMMARGWLERRRVLSERFGGLGARELRVMGGW